MLAQIGAFTAGSALTARLLRHINSMRLVPAGLIIIVIAGFGFGAGLHLLPTGIATVMGPAALWAFGIALLMPGTTTSALAGFASIAGAASALTGLLQVGGLQLGSAMLTFKKRLSLALIALATALTVVIATSVLPLADWILALGIRLHGYGLIGVVLFSSIYVAFTLVFVPASTFSLAAGLLYGVWGIPLSWASMMVAALIAFPLARGVLAGRVEALLAEQPRVRLVTDAINEEGWRMVLLVRVSGIVPFGLQNYLFGVTRISFVAYVLASSVGVLPSILLYAGIGAFGQASLDGTEMGFLKLAVLALSVTAALALVVITARRIRVRLK